MEQHLLSYLKDRKYPETYGKDEKRKLRSFAKKYVIRNNKLNWINHQNELREMLIRREVINSILHIFHDDKGHFGC